MDSDLLDNVLCFIMDDTVRACRKLSSDQILTLKISVETAEFLNMRPQFSDQQVAYLRELVCPFQAVMLNKMLSYCQITHDPWLTQWQ